ncbi:heat shock protein 90, putative [Eimeria tenella]|uniref:Heat shock protein 90, putative n=1 Tax=Eimeria tenella TaxID=5802 RepID=U6L4F2_EIMTE|nr:heat shock protein 90, putative [Eimeria tenella]CDJ42655.1 heat shock protein 90, putative [Eimeria tenella]|eukprot:XP_013233405.1 heat shock protein 90, putative [Eimeria tenella]
MKRVQPSILQRQLLASLFSICPRDAVVATKGSRLGPLRVTRGSSLSVAATNSIVSAAATDPNMASSRMWLPACGDLTLKEGFRRFTATASPAEATAGGVEGEEQSYPFQAETQKLLQIVAHSLYTDKEVFIRELISNASDALEKFRFLQATQQQQQEGDQKQQQGQLRVILRVNPSERTFVIEDNGVGMNRDELVKNLGTIARSGSLEFLKNAGAEASKDIIGQFGVGFYSSFVVSDRVEVFTRSREGGKVLRWCSDGSGTFSLSSAPADSLSSASGTKIVCHLKQDCLEFANPHRVKECAKKFSSFVNFPVYMEENGKEVQISSQEALWLKPSPTPEEHKQFFRHLTNQSWGEPFYSIMFSADAPLCIRSVLYFPADPPNRLFQTGPLESGVSLLARRVLVKKSATDLLPKWLWFLRGIVDCEDLPLNVSREHMQDSVLQRKLSTVIVKRILKFLNDQVKSDPEKYRQFYQKYSQSIKEGVLEDAHHDSVYKDMLLPLLRFECSSEDAGKMITFDEYLEKMPAKQKNIYYYCCSDRTTALSSPYMEQYVAKGRPVLLMTADIDEFLVMNLSEYKEKRLVAVDSPGEDAEAETADEEDEKTAKEKEAKPKLVGEQQTELAAFVKETLTARVTAVKFSDRLLSSPAVVSGFLSSTLRRMMKATLQGAPESQLNLASLPATLELNPSHELITSLYHLRTSNPDVAKLLVEQLYDNACVAAGIMEEPKTMVGRLNKLLSLTAQYAYHHAGGASQPASPSGEAAAKAEKAETSETAQA